MLYLVRSRHVPANREHACAAPPCDQIAYHPHLRLAYTRPTACLARADKTPRWERPLVFHTNCSYPSLCSCAALSSTQVGIARTRHRHSALLVGEALVGLLLLLGPNTASVITK